MLALWVEKSNQRRKNKKYNRKNQWKTAFTLLFGPFPVIIDHFRSQGITSGIWQCQLRLRSKHAVNTGSIDLRDLNVDRTLVKFIKNKKGGFDTVSGHSRTHDWTTRGH